MPNPLGAQGRGSVSIFGRKISYDALLLAAASLAGVFFLYKVGQVNQPAFDVSSIDPNAGSAGDFSTVSTQPPPTQTSGGYWGAPAPTGGTLPAIQPALQVASGGFQPAAATLVSLGSGGGPNTTGRSSGPQIFTAGAVSSFRAPKPRAPAGPAGLSAPPQNAQGKSRSSGGQIL